METYRVQFEMVERIKGKNNFYEDNTVVIAKSGYKAIKKAEDKMAKRYKKGEAHIDDIVGLTRIAVEDYIEILD